MVKKYDSKIDLGSKIDLAHLNPQGFCWHKDGSSLWEASKIDLGSKIDLALLNKPCNWLAV